MSLKQLESLYETFVKSGWLQEKCDEHNHTHADEIRAGKKFSFSPNLYALDRFIVRPATLPAGEPDACPLPRRMQQQAGLPEPMHKSSYAELVNPCGRRVDAFVSHFWGHPLSETMASLREWARRTHESLGKEQGDVVFWICLFALNQHRAGEEVGASPEEGPFNAALMQARNTIMVVDERVDPFRRIWCLYEVYRITSMKKTFELVSSLGPVGYLLDKGRSSLDPHNYREASRVRALEAQCMNMERALETATAFGAAASSEDDKYAIWHRIVDPRFRRVSLEHLRQNSLFKPSSFKRFDATVGGLLATPLFRASLRDRDAQGALRRIALGSAFGPPDLEVLESLGVAIVGGAGREPVQVDVRRGAEAVAWTILHCAAYFGHLAACQWLVESRANLEAQTRYGMTPLTLAASNDQTDIVRFLLSQHADPDVASNMGTPVHFAASTGCTDVVQLLLGARCEMAAVSKEGFTVLHQAVQWGHTETADLLLAARADIEALTRRGESVFHLAARNDTPDVVEVLLRHAGEEAGKLLEARCPSSRSSALESGASGNFRRSRDSAGQTALEIAEATWPGRAVASLLQSASNAAT